MAGLILLLNGRVKVKRSTNRKSALEKVGIGVLIFVLALLGIVNIAIGNSNALAAARTYVLNSDSLKREIGDIRGFGFTYSGGIEVSSDAAGERGTANISLIVKGSKKFRELNVYVLKENNRGWEVQSVQ
jgi:hypothetical protein